METVSAIATILELVSLPFLVVTTIVVLFRSRRPLAPVPTPDVQHGTDKALRELHEMSKVSQGRVHIHDVEQALRRNIG